MLNVIYVLKTCMLIMVSQREREKTGTGPYLEADENNKKKKFSRLTMGLQRDQTLVRCLAYYVAAGWLASEVAFFTACRPFRGYWAMPPPDPQCTTIAHYSLVQGCFNISADLLMLGIPVPLIARMRLPWRQKLVLTVVFSLGVFVVAAALLTKVFNLTDVYSPAYMFWYVREASVAVYVSNLPMIWPLLREWFPCLRRLLPGLATRQVRRAYDDDDSNNNKTARRRWLVGRLGRRGAEVAGGRRSGGGNPLRLETTMTTTTTGRKWTNTSTPTTAGTTGGFFEGDFRLMLSPPGEARTRGGGSGHNTTTKAPFSSLRSHDVDLELGVPDEKLTLAQFFGIRSTSSTNNSCNSSSSSSSSNNNSSHSNGTTRCSPGCWENEAVVYLDAPARAVTRVEAGSRAARARSAECLFVSVVDEVEIPARREEGEEEKRKDSRVQKQLEGEEGGGGGGGRQAREQEVGGGETRRARSPREEKNGIAL